jgi:lactoylglutathione lyase
MSMPSGNVPGLNLVVLRVADLDRAATFYRAIGLELAKEKHGNGPEHLAAVVAGVVIELYMTRNETESTSAVRLGFRVADVEATLAACEQAGGRLVSSAKDSAWGRRAVVDDPDGHRVELVELSNPDASENSPD